MGDIPTVFFGKAMTSRMLPSPHMIMTSLSNPGAIPPWGGGPNLKALRRKPESLFRVLGIEADDGENPFLDFRVMDTDRARGHLITVAHEVVHIAFHRTGIGFQGRQVLLLGHGEEVMGSFPFLLILVVLEQGEVHDPGEPELTGFS